MTVLEWSGMQSQADLKLALICFRGVAMVAGALYLKVSACIV